jgi:hypothetical protein
MNIAEAIKKAYPKSVDCMNKGHHIGQPVHTIERELADDRYYQIKVIRCGHCNMVISGGEYV